LQKLLGIAAGKVYKVYSNNTTMLSHKNSEKIFS